jgi:bilirubin oxidase
MDGGPHIPFSANTTWTPSFTITNDASTCWYHPHYHGATATQVAAGAGGFIIVRDGTEATKGLPWTYGVDDIPLAISSRTFNATTGQMVLADGTNSLAYAVGNTMLVNGVVKPQLTLPKQIVRLRMLNAELQRGLNLGLSDNSTFYVIGNDVGLLNAPAPVTRVQLTPGERVEVLLNLQNATVNSTTLNLMAYNNTSTDVASNFIATGARGSSPTTSTLTTTNFNILNIKIGNQTTSPICTPVTGNFSTNGSLTLTGASSPLVLANNSFYSTSNVTNNRTVTLTNSGGFGFDGNKYDEFYYNYAISLNSIEKWTIINNSSVSHPIHLHETKFNIVARKNLAGTGNGTAVTTNGLPAAWETGWKDTVYIPSNEQVQIIVKFDQYASNTNPYMFHCHMLTHEEEGFMGQFLVVNGETESLTVASFTSNATSSAKQIEFDSTTNTTYRIQYRADLADSWLDIGTITSDSGSSTTTYTDSDATRCANAKGFYRVVLPRIDTYPLISR